jgi:hypothetical protein
MHKKSKYKKKTTCFFLYFSNCVACLQNIILERGLLQVQDCFSFSSLNPFNAAKYNTKSCQKKRRNLKVSNFSLFHLFHWYIISHFYWIDFKWVKIIRNFMGFLSEICCFPFFVFLNIWVYRPFR